MKKLVLIAGLPRSGSTLLCNILNMNPRFHATATSPMIDMVSGLRSIFSHNITSKSHDRLDELENMRNGIRGFIEGYHSDKIVVFDKSRGWPAKLTLMRELYPDMDIKVIWTYRDPVQIINSIESKHQKTIMLEGNDEGAGANFATLSNRVDLFINDGGIVASPVWLLNDAYDMNLQDNIFIVKYGDLTNATQQVMDQIHNFIGEKNYPYSDKNFTDLKQTTNEFDGIYNYKFPHTIKEGSVKHVVHPITLPQYLIDRINQRFSWINDLVNT